MFVSRLVSGLRKPGITACAAALVLAASVSADAQGWGGKRTHEAPQLRGDTTSTNQGWRVRPLLTVGETTKGGKDYNQKTFGYRIPGILDGIGAYPLDWRRVRVLVNHEFSATKGYAYTLANKTKLVGGRVSYVDINRMTRKVVGMGPAYDVIYDRAGKVVTNEKQLTEGNGTGGLNRPCSAYGVRRGEYGFASNIFFTGEEVSEFGDTPADGHGGQEFVLDVDKGALYCAPMMGRSAFENVSPATNMKSDKVVILIGDDRQAAPLYLYIGQKNGVPAKSTGYAPPSFLVKNGLGLGNLYIWVSDKGDRDPSTFKGTGAVRSGKFVKVNHWDPSQAGKKGYDALGFASMANLDAQVDTLKAMRFSRPEDVAVNPKDGKQLVLASTGRSSFAGGADSWGTTYIVDIALSSKLLGLPLAKIDNIPCNLKIIYDGDDAGKQDYGIRSPDNLDWAGDGYIYIQEDRSVSGFGQTSGEEASVWQLDPKTSKAVRILQMDRSAVPYKQTDSDPTDIGDWESSGVLDVTSLFPTRKGEILLILDVQAHSLVGGGLAVGAKQDDDLVQGGQLLLVNNWTKAWKKKHGKKK